jgi:hypothetical protein
MRPHAPPPASQATARRVEQWVRLRLKQGGLPRPEAVFMVSAINGFGVKEMLGRIRDEMGFRADLWVVGAQNGERRQVWEASGAAAAAAPAQCATPRHGRRARSQSPRHAPPYPPPQSAPTPQPERAPSSTR